MIQLFLEIADIKSLTELSKTSGTKVTRLLDIKGLEDDNNSDTKNASKCKLILTEGLSAKRTIMEFFH